MVARRVVLTLRQKQVIALTVLGLSSAEIGGILGIRKKTVESCKNVLCHRLKVHPFSHLPMKLGTWHIDVAGKALTPQEERVLTDAATGLSREEIAARLSITVRTADYHFNHAFVKLKVHTLGQALNAAGTWTSGDPLLTELVAHFKEKLSSTSEAVRSQNGNTEDGDTEDGDTG